DPLAGAPRSENYDAEIGATLARVYESVAEFIGPTVVKIGNRRFWNAMFEYLGLDATTARNAFVLIDKKDKLDDFVGALTDVVGANVANEINKVFTDGYKSFLNKNNNLDSAISDMERFMDLLKSMGVNNAEIDLGIMRGHAYYTGVVFEFFLTRFPELGAVGGGGRYEDLASKFSKTKIIGVGAAVGFSRLMVALLDENKIDLSSFARPIDAAVLVMGDECVPYAMSVLAALRGANIVAVPYLDAHKKFKNQIEFADKIKSGFSVIIGTDEVKNQTVSVKNMQTGNQQTVALSAAIELMGM
ncbi:MAG: histidine--tRNA ligase family protein, partial [Alphaproteobacteria bacterium]|nr:histidine--tRNA ligase family protein [Alphaproteobacteria bacterium]